MSDSGLAVEKDSLVCAICTEVYRSPRFLPCYHTFCLPCLEELANRHGSILPCPTCRASVPVPPGGVCDLQVNFYLTEEALEWARSEDLYSTCPVHTKQHVIFYCTQCEQAICMRCKLTKHEGHVTDDLSDAAARCKKTVEEHLHRLDDSIQVLIEHAEAVVKIEERAKEKRDAVAGQIRARYDFIVEMAGKCRDHALRELQTMDGVEDELALRSQKVQDELLTLISLRERASVALSSSCDTDILQVEREMRRREGSPRRLRNLDVGLTTITWPGLHSNFSNDLKDHMKRFIGSPVTLSFPFDNKIIRVSQCADGECREVHALREMKDKRMKVSYGGPGGDFSKEKEVWLNPDGSQNKSWEHGTRVSYNPLSDHSVLKWKDPAKRKFYSKSDRMFLLQQDCDTGQCYVCCVDLELGDRKGEVHLGTILSRPNESVHLIHNFDSNKSGTFFVLIDENKGDKIKKEQRKNGQEQTDGRSPRVVRLYSHKCNSPLATYTSPLQPFFPTDVCFYSQHLLLIADWMNDCVHVAKVADNDLRFMDYLPGSGAIVRPTALNLDLNGHLMIGCGDGWVLRYPVDINAMEKRLSSMK